METKINDMKMKIPKPHIMWTLLILVLFVPRFFEFDTRSSCRCQDKEETYNEMVNRIKENYMEIHDRVKEGQIKVKGEYVVFYAIYLFLFTIIVLYNLIEENKMFISGLKYLQTKEGQYFYKLNVKDKNITIYEANLLTFTEYISDSIDLNRAKTTDIIKYLEKEASKIDQRNLSYIKEELTTWKRF